MNKLLSDQHHQMLQDSGLPPETIQARGYFTATTPNEVPGVFSASQRKLVPALVIPHHGVGGGNVGYEIRPDSPRKSQNGKSRKYESAQGVPAHLDVPPASQPYVGDPAKDLWVTEGCKKADALASRDAVALTLMGVWSWRGTNAAGGKVELSDWDAVALNGRNVYLVFDSDVVEKDDVRLAMKRLASMLNRRGATVFPVKLEPGPNGSKVGVDDFLVTGTLEDLKARVDYSLLNIKAPDDTTAVFELLADAYEFHCDDQGNPFGCLNGTKLAHYVSGGDEMADAARRLYRKEYKKVPSGSSVGDALAQVASEARDLPRVPVYTRVAHRGNLVELDLGNDRYVTVTEGGWAVTDKPESIFYRPATLKTLPEPQHGGSLQLIRDVLNVDEEGWKQAKAWLLGLLFADVPRPLLVLEGPQGSGKTVAAELLLAVLDPRKSLTAFSPKHDPIIEARDRFLLGYDNLSKISPEQSDLLCQLVTGFEDSRRILYTTGTKIVYSMQRTGVLTGIGIEGMREDLIERSIRLELSVPEDRIATTDLWASFNRNHGKILGALLSGAAQVMANLSATKTPTTRLADFGKIVAAYDKATGGDLLSGYAEKVSESMESAASDDPVATLLLELVEKRGAISMLGKDLHRALLDLRHESGQLGGDFPANASQLSRHLTRSKVALKRQVTIESKRSGKGVKIVVTPVGLAEEPEAVVEEELVAPVSKAVVTFSQFGEDAKKDAPPPPPRDPNKKVNTGGQKSPVESDYDRLFEGL